jgi:hypothetical protein
MDIYTHIMMMVMFNDEEVCRRVCLYGVVANTNVMCVSSFALLLLRILVRKKSTSTHTHTHTNKQTNKRYVATQTTTATMTTLRIVRANSLSLNRLARRFLTTCVVLCRCTLKTAKLLTRTGFQGTDRICSDS